MSSARPPSQHRIPLPEAAAAVAGTTAGLLVRPAGAWGILVLGHGAGAGMEHPHLERLAALLAAHGLATLRYQFPYMDQGRRRPDRPSTLEATVRAAVEFAGRREPTLPLFAGGRSMGGRMTTRARASGALPGVRGLVLFAYPLHPAARVADPDPPLTRAEHLRSVPLPMLFLQGTRDRLARLHLLQGTLDSLGENATLHLIDEGDHGFSVPKRSGRTSFEIEEELATVTARWCRALVAEPPSGAPAQANPSRQE